jgi:ankyrin repeat protein
MTRRAGPRLRAWRTATFLLFAAIPTLAATSKVSAPVLAGFSEFYGHLIEPRPLAVTPWKDRTDDYQDLTWKFELTVDELGVVTAARLISGHREFRDEATRTARAVRFRPFVRDGQPVTVRGEFIVWSRSVDYAGPADRSFPATPDLSTTLIALNRSSCYGTCPSYRVELRGDGEVHYRGDSNVLVPGSHDWRIDPAKITPLLDLLRRADYFTLAGYYEFPVSDMPTYITRLSIGDRSKFVLNYGGGGMGGAFASTRMPGEVPDMPSVVTEIERAIDEISGVATYVRGDETTLQRLRDEHWNFRSQDAGEGLRMLLSRCNTTLAREFIRAGAPVDVYGKGFGAGLPIGYAARCADVELVRLMVSKGALNVRSDAKSFLWSSVESGFPDMVAIALKHYGNVNSKDEDGGSMLAHSARSYVNDDDPGVASFDSAKVVEMLIDAGADPNVRDKDGRTPLFEANRAAVATTLLRRGADLNARDNARQTALFNQYHEEPKTVLLAAGADVDARDKLGRTALFYQQYPQSIKVLADAGAKVDALDLEGNSAIEKVDYEECVLALLAAGAKLPSDPARLNAMIATATVRKWTRVRPLLEAAAAGK